jgi:cytochrome c-type biogenesis protein CcmH/NrfG
MMFRLRVSRLPSVDKPTRRSAWMLIVVLALQAAWLPADWEQGRAAFALGDYQTAAAAFEEVLATRPSYAPGHFMLGLARYHLKLTEAAIASLARAAEIDPGNVQYRLALVRAELDGARFDDALANIVQVEMGAVPGELRREYAQLLGQAADRGSRSADAVARLEAATAAYPSDAFLWLSLGRARSAAGNDVGAFEAFSKANQVDGANPEAARSAATVAIRIANTLAEGADRGVWYGWAAELADKAATATGTVDDALLAGESFLGAVDYARASQWLERAVTRDPGSPLGLYLLGRADLGLARTEQALGHLRNALERVQDERLRRAIAYSVAQADIEQRDLAAAEKVLLELGDSDAAARLRRLAEVASGNPGDAARSCVDRWVKLQGTKEDRRRYEGTPAWGAIVAEEATLLAGCREVLGLP